jgi:hypothetical protein
MKLIPTPSGYPDLTVSVTLTGSVYRIRWQWNQRASMWTFSIDSPSGVRLLSGVPVLINSDLLAWAPPSDERPPYAILVVDASGAFDEPTLESLGARVRVVYAEPAT